MTVSQVLKKVVSLLDMTADEQGTNEVMVEVTSTGTVWVLTIVLLSVIVVEGTVAIGLLSVIVVVGTGGMMMTGAEMVVGELPWQPPGQEVTTIVLVVLVVMMVELLPRHAVEVTGHTVVVV